MVYLTSLEGSMSIVPPLQPGDVERLNRLFDGTEIAPLIGSRIGLRIADSGAHLLTMYQPGEDEEISALIDLDGLPEQVAWVVSVIVREDRQVTGEIYVAGGISNESYKLIAVGGRVHLHPGEVTYRPDPTPLAVPPVRIRDEDDPSH